MHSSREKLVAVIVLVGLLAAGAVGYWLLRGRGLGPASSLGPAFEYDLTQFNKARSVGTYRLVSQTQPAVQGHCIAVDPAGELYIGGDGKIAVCDREGKPTRTVTVDAVFPEQKSAREVRGLVVAADGTIYVGLAGGIAICKSGGGFASFWARPGSVITSIALSNDAVYAADFATASVLCLTRQGRLMRTIDGKNGPSGGNGFVLPSPYFDVAVAQDGLLRIANTGLRRVEAWTPAGSREFTWGKGGPGLGQFSGCCNPAAIAVFADGRIVTAEKGSLLTVTIYKPDGPQEEAGGRRLETGGAAGTSSAAADNLQPAISAVVAGPDRFHLEEEGGVDLAVAPSGRVYVLQTPTGVLSIFDPPMEGKP